MAAVFATGGVIDASSTPLVGEGSVAPCRLAERHAIRQLIDRSQSSGTVRADVLLDQEPPHLGELLSRPLLRRFGRTQKSRQQRRHTPDGTP